MSGHIHFYEGEKTSVRQMKNKDIFQKFRWIDLQKKKKILKEVLIEGK